MNEIKIYTLSHPITNEIRYVGKTSSPLEERLRKHLLKHDNTYRDNWITSLVKNNLRPKIELLDECDYNDWRWTEKYWILQFKIWGFKLTNICEGGLGSNGMKHKPESIEKMRIASIGNKYRQGKIFSNESIEKIRLGNLNKKIKPESIEKMKKSKLGISTGIGRKHTVDHINNIINSLIKLKGKSVIQYDLNMNKIFEWISISEASKQLKIPNSNIVNVCKGNRKTAKNFIWKYN
jgi:group I intron endonuclease